MPRLYKKPLVSMLIAMLALCACGQEPFVPSEEPGALSTEQELFLPFVQHSATASRQASQPTAARPATEPAAQAKPSSRQNYLPLVVASEPPEPTPIAQTTAFDPSNCALYPNVRITWYELSTCCGKTPNHPQYGITRSGLPVEWGVAAVQAQRPLFPIGTQFIVTAIGPEYRFVVTDTGSETAFGSNWIDLYAPTVAIGLELERRIGLSGRSDVLVCPD